MGAVVFWKGFRVMEATKDIAQFGLMTERDALISIAISLKRLADFLDGVKDDHDKNIGKMQK